jgi:hypothetical protein
MDVDIFSEEHCVIKFLPRPEILRALLLYPQKQTRSPKLGAAAKDQ